MPQSPDASQAPQRADTVRPLHLHLDRQRSLTVEWADGRRSEYPLAYLRSKCPCATCRESPPSGGSGLSLNILPANFQSRGVAAAAWLVGNYAIQIRWADGHETGIYDFQYLRSIDPASAADAGRVPPA